MGYLLLAIEALVAGWLAVALLAAVTCRLHSVLVRFVFQLAGVTVIMAPCALLTCAAMLLRGRKLVVPLFWPLVVVDALFIIGAVVVWIRGHRAAARMLTEDSIQPSRFTMLWSPGRLALALAIALLLLNSTFLGIDAAIRQHLSDVRTEAETLALSVAPQPVPDRDNAAALYVQLGDYFGRPPAVGIWPVCWDEAVRAASHDHSRAAQHSRQATGDSSKPPPGFDFRRADLAEFLDRQQGARRMILEAASRPGCYFSRDYGRPRYDMLLPEIGDIRACSKLLLVDAHHRAAKRDIRGALEDIQALYGLSDHAAGDPLIVTMLVSIAIDRMAGAALANLASTNEVSPADLSNLKIDPGVSHFERMSRALRMEEAAILGIFSDFDQRGGILPEELTALANLARGSLYRVFMLPNDLAGFRRYIRAEIYSPSQPFKQIRERREAAEEALTKTQPGPVTMIMMPALRPLIDAVANGEVARRLARVGLAMYQYRAAKGAFPDRLEDLSPEFLAIVPRDPFDGQPLRLRKTDSGYVVYSVGMDLVDNGGAPEAGTEGDLLFECVAPTAAQSESKATAPN